VDAAQVIRKCHIRQKTLVCSRIDEGVKQNVRNKNEIVDSIPPIDR